MKCFNFIYLNSCGHLKCKIILCLEFYYFLLWNVISHVVFLSTSIFLTVDNIYFSERLADTIKPPRISGSVGNIITTGECVGDRSEVDWHGDTEENIRTLVRTKERRRKRRKGKVCWADRIERLVITLILWCKFRI